MIIIIIIKNKKENLRDCGLCCPSRQQKKLKESEKKNKYLDLAKELEKLWNMEMTVIPIIIGALGTISKRKTWK